MALAGQASGAHEAIGQRDAALLLDIHRSLELPRLWLWLFLLPLGRGRVAIVRGLSLLVVGAFSAGRLRRNASVAGLSQGVALGFSCFLLLLQFCLLLDQAFSDVVHARRLVDRLPAELALNLGRSGLEGHASRQTEANPAVHGGYKRGNARALERSREGVGKFGALLGGPCMPATCVCWKREGPAANGDLDGLDGNDFPALGGEKFLVYLLIDDGVLGERVPPRLTPRGSLAKRDGGRHGDGIE
jgi:hypothetical protein